MSSDVIPGVIRKNPHASGFAIIISNDYANTPGLETLKGTHKDSQRMEDAFRSLNIATLKAHNITKLQLEALLSDAAQCKEYPEGSKCIAFVFSGHGLSSNQIYMQDGELMHISNDIIQPLLPSRAPRIGTIPKLFFIDACRGSRDITPVVVAKSAEGAVQEIHQKGGTDVTLKLPPEGNFLVAYSTMPEYRSYEMQGDGGVWMTTLAEKLRTSQDYVEVILSDVRKELLQRYQSPGWPARMQQPETLSRLNEKVCLAQGVKQIGRQAALIDGATAGFHYPSVTQKSSQHPGHFRGLLNQMSQRNELTNLSNAETEVKNEKGNVVGFISVVTCIHQGIQRKFKSRGVHATKSSAHESAAEEAFNTVGRSLDRGGNSTVHPTPSKPLKTPTSTGASPKSTAPSVSPSNKTPVMKLKELCEQQKWPQPQYTPVPQLEEQRFQFQATVKAPTRLVTARGSVCGSKSEAKHSAAQAALQRL